MFGWLVRVWRGDRPAPTEPSVIAVSRSVAAGGNIVNSPITQGLDEAGVRQVFREELGRIAQEKGVPEPPLRAVLDKLGQAGVPFAEIPARLDAAADELIRLRADLARLRNDRPEFAAIRARAAALIDKGDFDAARAALQEGRSAARLMREELGRSEAAFLVDEARVDRLQLNHESACAKFAEAAGLDPDDCWIRIELGDLWTLRGSLAKAGESYWAAAKIAGNQGNDRDLSVSYALIGDVQREQGDLAAALKSYRASLAIAERLAQADPGNAGWQRDLSVSHNNIGDVQRAQGDLAAALKSYQADLSIAERLAQADPGNAGWQRDLALSHGRLGLIHAGTGARENALAAFRQGRAIIARLTTVSPDSAVLPRDLAQFDRQIADLAQDGPA